MRTVLFLWLVLAVTPGSTAKTLDRPIRIGVLPFGESPTARLSTEKLRRALAGLKQFLVSDSELTNAAAKGNGYSGSLNLSVAEARDLGAALDTDFYLIGDAQTLRRSSSQLAVYFESYCSLFIVSSRTGQLIFWDRLAVQDSARENAEHLLMQRLESAENHQHWVAAILRAADDERTRRAVIVDANQPLIEAPDDDEKKAEAQGLQLPRPYRRLRPEYPDSAARADAEGTVDVIADVGADGEVGQVQIARWAGFGLDEITLASVRQMHFFPARQNGTPIAMRVLLRYNFRKSQK